jgi:hypothetical protein
MEQLRHTLLVEDIQQEYNIIRETTVAMAFG